MSEEKHESASTGASHEAEPGGERASFVLKMFEEGKHFTEELLRENASLRHQQVALRSQLRELEARVAAANNENMEQRLREAEAGQKRAEAELFELRRQLNAVEDENREFAERYVRIERQNGNLASLYVASHNLHSTLDFQAILGSIKEIVINLVGSESFGVYFLDEAGRSAVRMAHEGLDEDKWQTLRVDGALSSALRERQVYVAAEPPSEERPLAVIPLCTDDEEIGAIVIFRLLDHKQGLGALDRELLDLLAGQAATALCAARLYSESERKRSTLEGFFQLLKVSA